MMAGSLDTNKKSVNLASAGPRVSRIRRDPPPVVKEKVVDQADRDEWAALVGVVSFALALVVIIFGFASAQSEAAKERRIEVTIEG
jgi:hypothetical protein